MAKEKPSTALVHLRAAEAAMRGRPDADLRPDEIALRQGIAVLVAALREPDGATARGMAALHRKLARQAGPARRATASAEELLAHMAQRFDGFPWPVDWREFGDEVYEFFGSNTYAAVMRAAFLAHVARRLPNKALRELGRQMAGEALEHMMDVDADWAAFATSELERAIGPAWEAAALKSKTFAALTSGKPIHGETDSAWLSRRALEAGADSAWLSRRALEAMGLDPNKVTTAQRMRTGRERKKAKAAKKK